MRVKLLTIISFFSYQLSISQSEKLLHGKVLSQNSVLEGVEVINKTAKTSTTTNDLGEFLIPVNVKDSLLFYAKDYFFSRLRVSKENTETNNLAINMILKPEELREVVITKIKLEKVKISQQDINEIKLAKQSRPLQKYTGVYDGTITSGIDFIAIGKGIFNLLKKDEEPKNAIPKIDFKTLIAKTVPDTFFIKDLKLNPDEKELFLQFCDADPKSKTLLEHPNILGTMDFLTAKNEEFKKLKTEPKN